VIRLRLLAGRLGCLAILATGVSVAAFGALPSGAVRRAMHGLYLERAEARPQLVVPATLLLYLNFGRLAETAIVMLSLPFALVGGFWLVWWMGFNMSVAVGVGFIALAGVVMLIYLDQALVARRALCSAAGRPVTREDLKAAIMDTAGYGLVKGWRLPAVAPSVSAAGAAHSPLPVRQGG
jgi:hypothetical protein